MTRSNQLLEIEGPAARLMLPPQLQRLHAERGGDGIRERKQLAPPFAPEEESATQTQIGMIAGRLKRRAREPLPRGPPLRPARRAPR